MSDLTAKMEKSGTEANLVPDFTKRLNMAKLIYGSTIDRTRKYLQARTKPSLLMIDRYLLLCKSNIKDLEEKQDALFYGDVSNSEDLVKLKEQLESLECELWIEKKALTNAGFENSLLKCLPASKIFSDLG